MELSKVTFEQLVGAIAVILLLCGAYSTLMSAVKTRREEIKIKAEPMNKVKERLDDHENWLAADKRRIEALEHQQSDLIEHNKQQDHLANINVRAQLAMLRHMQHGNNADGMKASEQEITDYLTGKKE